MGVGLSDLVAPSAGPMGRAAQVGPVQYTNVRLADDAVLPCISFGLVLVKDERPLALLVTVSSGFGASSREVSVEVMGKTREDADRSLPASAPGSALRASTVATSCRST